MTNLEKKSQPSESEIKEFWEWCGFKETTREKYVSWNQTITLDVWELGDYSKTDLPDIDLYNLFKYAVPKLDSLTDINLYLRGEEWKVDLIFFDIPAVRGTSTDPVLALFWAIREVIKK